MPYQTLPVFFNFNFSSSAITPLPLSPSPSQAETAMECVDTTAALKSSFRPQMVASVKPTPQQQQPFTDDVWAGDEFFVDELLDFSNEDMTEILPKQQEEEEEDEEKDCCCASFSSLEETHFDKTSNSNSNSTITVMEDFGAGLSVPTDDLANLEWLSHFVEDSFSEIPTSNDSVPIFRENLSAIEEGKNQSPTQNGWKENRVGCLGLTMETRVPAKARSKRSRTDGRIWSLSGPHKAESSSTPSSSSSSSATSSFSSSSSPSSCLIFTTTSQKPDLFYCLGKPPSKKPKQGKKKPLAVSKNSHSQSQLQNQRRCSHCLVQKTPQWRTGPLGSKTLCNACGVRYKSGRLLPEYRPAGSPTFLSTVHSNSHRKVLEMRRKKELSDLQPGLPAVQSF